MKRALIIVGLVSAVGLTVMTCSMMTMTRVELGRRDSAPPPPVVSDSAAKAAYRAAQRTGDHYQYGSSVVVGRELVRLQRELDKCRGK